MGGHNHVTAQGHMDPYMPGGGRRSVRSEVWLPERSWQQELRTKPQVTGVLLAGAVGALASVITLALIVKWVCYAPSMPTIPNDLDREKARVVIENYKLLQQAALE